jgi:hypothetical protein
MKPPMTAIARRASVAEQSGLRRGAQATEDDHLGRGKELSGRDGFRASGCVAEAEHLPGDYGGEREKILKCVSGLELAIFSRASGLDAHVKLFDEPARFVTADHRQNVRFGFNGFARDEIPAQGLGVGWWLGLNSENDVQRHRFTMPPAILGWADGRRHRMNLHLRDSSLPGPAALELERFDAPTLVLARLHRASTACVRSRRRDVGCERRG